MSTEPRPGERKGNSTAYGKYELRERLGRGGMAEVWKAFDTQLQRFVAIKILHADLRSDPNFMTRFLREAQAIASLRHPNIVQVHDFHTASEEGDTIAYMVMNYVEGPTLAEYIYNTSRMGRFPPATDLVNLFVAISRAIDYAHQRGMVHRDIKPSNILLDKHFSSSRYPRGMPILTDFGIVKLLGSSSNTLSKSLLGTPTYISPEQAQGDPGNERSDIYSLGVILYEICTGVRPFQGDTPIAIMMQHLTAMPTSPALINPNIPPALTEVILRCLAKEPAARYTRALEMTSAMADALNLSTLTNLHSPLYTEERTTWPVAGNSSQVNLVAQQNITPPASQTPIGPGQAQLRVGLSQTGAGLSQSEAAQAQAEVGQMQMGAGHPQGVPLHVQNVEAPLVGGISTPRTPTGSTSIGASSTQYAQNSAAQQLAALAPAHPPISTPGHSPAPGSIGRQKRKSILWLSAALLIVVLVGATVGAIYFATHKNSSTTTTTNQLAGHAYFDSSGVLNGGIADELHVVLNGVSGPDSSKSYYVWLMGDINQGNGVAPLLLGLLNVNQGKVDITYPHDQQFTNLLEHYSRLLITEENANSKPTAPASDQHTWRYSAQIPQTPSQDVEHLSTLDYIRQLLVTEANLKGLHTGMAIQFLRNVHTVWDLARTASDNWGNKDVNSLRNQVISILDYLDGTSVSLDAPGASLLVDAKLIQLPLLDRTVNQNPGSYFKMLDDKLSHLKLESDVTAEMTNLANQAISALPGVQNNWLGPVLKDAQQLMKMNDAQLLQASTKDILTDIVNRAGYAYNGRADSSTNSMQGGAAWINEKIQGLATFEVKTYTSS